MSSIGNISLDLSVNRRDFNKQVNSIQGHTTKAFNSMSVAVGNILSNLATKALASIGDFVKDSINKGSELSELQNVVDSVFTTMSDKVETFSQNALSAYGLTEAQSKKMVGTFGAMSKSFGYTEKQAYAMSTALTGLAGDVASFYNLSHDEAYTKLKSVFSGETESLKELGVVMSQTALDEFALEKGFGKVTNAMSEREKVALRLAFVQDKLSVASGDFLKTQDQWANQTRILTGQFESFKAAIGQGFINVLTPIIRVLNTIMAKLVQLANAFKSFTEMIMGKKNNGGAGAVMQEVADAAEEAANSTGGVEDAAEGAASAAKKAQKSLMGFDEINKLTKADTGSEGGSGGGVSFDDIDFGGAVEEQERITNAAFEGIKAKIKELIALFKEGFKAGLGTDFENSLVRIKAHISSIGTSFKDIFTDPKVTKSINTYFEKYIYALGQFTGSLTSIGASLGEMLFGGLDKYLKKNKNYFKKRLVGILDATGEYWAIAGNLSQAISSIFEVLRGDSAKGITADLIGIISNAALGIYEIATKIGRDILNLISQPIIDNKDKIKVALEKTLAPINKLTTTLNNAVKDTFEKVIQVYNTYVSPAIKRITDGLSSISSAMLNAYTKHIAPVLDKLAKKFSEVWASQIQPAINKGIEAIGKIIELLSVLWKNVLAPLISWIIQNIVPVLTPIFEKVGGFLITLLGTLFGVVGGILEALGGLIDFLIGAFSGDWERAWEGIKTIFSGIWAAIKSILNLAWQSFKETINTALTAIKGNITTVFNSIKTIATNIWNGIKTAIMTVVNGIKSGITTAFSSIKTVITTAINGIKTVIQNVFNSIWTFMKNIINTILGGIESLVNGVIGGLNAMINAMNKMSFDVPDWVPNIGGKSFGLDIPKASKITLPRLAEGGYVKANQPQPVIIGDNKTQGEIVAPEGKLLAITLQALEQFFGRLKDMGYSSKGDGEVGDIIIPIYLDGSMLDEVIVTAQQRRNLRSGGR